MSLELLYTSAPQGLKAGSKGFCTVLSTVGMPINIATKLESLSGYRHVFPPSHPDASRNPVCYSHFKINTGGRQQSILSRISDYGIDYSQRTNKLAHHVVVDPSEQILAGPTSVLMNSSVMRSNWNGQCTNLPSGPRISGVDTPSGACNTWQQVCGDERWAAVVADAWLAQASKTVWIVFDLNQSHLLLQLLSEAVALLPPAQRWKATFSTYATNLPPDIDCRVRCVLEGSEEARLAAARGLTIRLKQTNLAPPSTPALDKHLVLPGSSTGDAGTGGTSSTEDVGSRSLNQFAMQFNNSFSDSERLSRSRIDPTAIEEDTAGSSSQKFGMRPHAPMPTLTYSNAPPIFSGTKNPNSAYPIIFVCIGLVSLLFLGATGLLVWKFRDPPMAEQASAVLTENKVFISPALDEKLPKAPDEGNGKGSENPSLKDESSKDSFRQSGAEKNPPVGSTDEVVITRPDGLPENSHKDAKTNTSGANQPASESSGERNAAKESELTSKGPSNHIGIECQMKLPKNSVDKVILTGSISVPDDSTRFKLMRNGGEANGPFSVNEVESQIEEQELKINFRSSATRLTIDFSSKQLEESAKEIIRDWANFCENLKSALKIFNNIRPKNKGVVKFKDGNKKREGKAIEAYTKIRSCFEGSDARLLSFLEDLEKATDFEKAFSIPNDEWDLVVCVLESEINDLVQNGDNKNADYKKLTELRDDIDGIMKMRSKLEILLASFSFDSGCEVAFLKSTLSKVVDGGNVKILFGPITGLY